MEDILRIVTQNLNKADKSYIDNYKEKVQAEIYTFQEVKKGNAGTTEIHIADKSFSNITIQIKETTPKAEEIWNDTFHKERHTPYRKKRNSKHRNPWEYDFRDGYWKEGILNYKGEKIFIINIHLSPDETYQEQLRYLLIKYMYDLEKEYENVLLLGDFNAAEYYQTEKPNTWEQSMYHTITDIFVYK